MLSSRNVVMFSNLVWEQKRKGKINARFACQAENIKKTNQSCWQRGKIRERQMEALRAAVADQLEAIRLMGPFSPILFSSHMMLAS